MRQRSLSVVLDQIHIIDDGADGDTTGSFKVWVLNGARLKNRFDVPEQAISDSPSPGNISEEFIRFSDISPDVTVEIGPDTVTTTGINRNDTLGMLTRAQRGRQHFRRLSAGTRPRPRGPPRSVHRITQSWHAVRLPDRA